MNKLIPANTEGAGDEKPPHQSIFAIANIKFLKIRTWP